MAGTLRPTVPPTEAVPTANRGAEVGLRAEVTGLQSWARPLPQDARRTDPAAQESG